MESCLWLQRFRPHPRTAARRFTHATQDVRARSDANFLSWRFFSFYLACLGLPYQTNQHSSFSVQHSRPLVIQLMPLKDGDAYPNLISLSLQQ